MAPRLERRFGFWILRDDAAGYYAEMKGADSHIFQGDFFKGLGVEEFVVAGMLRNDDAEYDPVKPRTYEFDEVP